MELGETEIMKVRPPGKTATTTLSVARDVVRAQGFSGLFAGLAPRILKVAPACAIMISSYEYGKRFFKDYNDRHRTNAS